MKVNAPLSTYAQVYTCSIKETFVFKLDFILMSSSALCLLIVQYYFLRHIFSSSTTVSGYDFSLTLTYLILNCAISGLYSYNVDMHLNYAIQGGTIISLLSKPVSIPLYYFSKGFGIITSKAMTETVLLLIVSVLFFHPIVLPNLVNLALFLFSFTLSLVLYLLIALCVGFLTFCIEDNSSIMTVIFLLRSVCSGSVFPLDFFPEIIQHLAKLFPFHLMIDKPFKIFLGLLTTNECIKILLSQLAWIAGLYVVMKIIFRLGVRRYHSIGG